MNWRLWVIKSANYLAELLRLPHLSDPSFPLSPLHPPYNSIIITSLFQLLPQFSHTQRNPDLTFSSPEATLEASSMTQPTAMRAAPDECSSFQMVSLSTWANSQERKKKKRKRKRDYKRKQISEGGLAGWQPMYNNISLPSWPAEKTFWTWLCLYFFSTLTSPMETHSFHASLPFPV